MTSTCIISTPSTAGTRNAAGFRKGSTTVYNGSCRVSDGGLRRLTVGGTETEQATRTLNLPATTTGVSDGDLATITSGDCQGLVLRLLEVTPKDQSTALRIPCLEDS